MKISIGSDYYDSALSYGIDEQISFVRTEKFYSDRSTTLIPCISIPELFLLDHSHRWGSRYGDSFRVTLPSGSTTEALFRRITVYFAGKRYVGLVAFTYGVTPTSFSTHQESIWTYDALVNFARNHGLSLNPKISEKNFRPRDATPAELDWLVKEKIAIAYFLERNYSERVEGYIPGPTDSLHPWVCNSASKEHCLSRYGFYKALDPYSAMQELSMFIGGVLGNVEPNTVQITDEKTLVAKHGFDKWSFRKKSAKSKI